MFSTSMDAGFILGLKIQGGEGGAYLQDTTVVKMWPGRTPDVVDGTLKISLNLF